ncbi:Ankyrin repeat domain-containing protein 1 [Hondaea fermentalgiana]|uniref:Ankyrin repeat domain-containing protein 1 n=1 Tax=Hondaea fermentalgiana TaxID=2315210 RepID=A0A2R5GNT0_9STRA|nr:Ankyrin repeat domain-containing protein 1 [Hondaea fermentalgiana]|eukprot:GBG30283.1 Ankyrin repeat domain-containing protein 1 [Hondaea fermentalgiana]
MDLFDAVFYEDVDAVYKNIFEDVDVNAPNAAGNRPLHAAAHAGNVKIAEILLRAGAKPSGLGRAGNTPLHYAAKQKHLAMVELLLRMGADPTVRNDKRFSPRDLCLALRRDETGGSSFFVVEAELSVEDSLDPETKQIVDALDKAIMDSSEVLGAPRIVFADFDRDTASPMPGGRVNEDGSAPISRDGSRSPLNSLDSNVSSVHGDAAASNVDGESAMGPVNGTGGAGVNAGEELHSGRSRKSSLSSAGGMLSPTDTAGRPGYWLEVDGRQIFIKLTESDSEDEDDNENDNDDDNDNNDNDGDGESAQSYQAQTSAATMHVSSEVTYEEHSDRGDQNLGKDGNSDGQNQQVRQPSSRPGGAWTFSVHLTPGEVGLGMQLMESGRFTRVSALHPAGPALAAGVQCEDLLTRVNDCSTDGLTVSAVKSLLSQEVAIHQDIELAFQRPA